MSNVEVVKVSNERPSSRQIQHGNSPRLYLELIENKNRVKQDLINKEYVPPQTSTNDVTMSDIEDDPIDVPEEDTATCDDDSFSIKDDYNDGNDSREVHETAPHSPSFEKDAQYSGAPSKLDERIDEMFRNIPESTEPTDVPSLSEVTNGERKYFKDITQVTKSEVDEEDEKRQLLFKFDLLRKQYRDSATHIPEFTIHSDLCSMQKSYDVTLQRVILDASVEDYKNYFQKACFGMEVALNYFGFDITGFTNDQMTKMNTYERLLIELCAKHYSPGGSSIPVEIRLIAMVAMNAAMFIGLKIMEKKISAGMAPLATPPESPQQPQELRKMRGPQNVPDIVNPSAQSE